MLRLASPFDFPRQGRLVIPAMDVSSIDIRRHTAELAAWLPGMITTHGTLVLFASARQMCTVAAAIDRGDVSVILGLASFAEGVDQPGAYCTHVILAKLAFPCPETPFEEARQEGIASQSKSVFVELYGPETAIRLAQAVGRLLRTSDD